MHVAALELDVGVLGDLLAGHLLLLVASAAGERDEDPDDDRQGEAARHGVAEQQAPLLGRRLPLLGGEPLLASPGALFLTGHGAAG